MHVAVCISTYYPPAHLTSSPLLSGHDLLIYSAIPTATLQLSNCGLPQNSSLAHSCPLSGSSPILAMALTDGQEEAILLTERIASVFSLVGCAIIMGTFIGSHRFRKPVNRLIFYASWGNMLANIATLMSTAGIVAGSSSALCQFQGFMIQMYVLSRWCRQ